MFEKILYVLGGNPIRVIISLIGAICCIGGGYGMLSCARESVRRKGIPKTNLAVRIFALLFKGIILVGFCIIILLVIGIFY